jgi:hypothetical protein
MSRFANSARQRRLRTIVLAAAGAILIPASTLAQSYSPAPHPGWLEIGGGAVWTAGYDAGRATATESPNSSTGAPALTLFTTRARVPAVAGIEARAALFPGDRFSVEAAFQFSRPTLRVRLDDDFENAERQDAVGGLSSYVVAGSVLYHFGSGRIVPFVIGGGGYIRQLDEDNAGVLTGNEVHAGGGVKLWFGARGYHRIGLRVDAQASARSRSAAFEQKRRVLPVVGAGLIYRF